MVTFTPVDPASIATERQGRRGRVSYPIIKAFLESNTKLVKLNTNEHSKPPAYLRAVLFAYINSHQLPIKIFSSGGEMYLMRLDLDNNNNPIPWSPIPKDQQTSEGSAGLERNLPALPLDDEEVDRRFLTEQHQTTK